jgi:hypothetical protein
VWTGLGHLRRWRKCRKGINLVRISNTKCCTSPWPLYYLNYENLNLLSLYYTFLYLVLLHPNWFYPFPPVNSNNRHIVLQLQYS